MKYFVWIFMFTAYLLMVIGLFLLIDGGLEGTDIEENDTFQFIFGFISIFIALSGGYVAADFLGKSWHGENPDEPDRKKDLSKWIVFTVVFVIMFALFRLHDTLLPALFPNINNLYLSIKIAIFRINLHEFLKVLVLPFEVNKAMSLLSLPGLFFMAITITLTYVFTGLVNKLMSAGPTDDAPVEDKE